MALETKLAEASLTRVENRDPQKTYNKRTLAALAAEAPGLRLRHAFSPTSARPRPPRSTSGSRAFFIGFASARAHRSRPRRGGRTCAGTSCANRGAASLEGFPGRGLRVQRKEAEWALRAGGPAGGASRPRRTRRSARPLGPLYVARAFSPRAKERMRVLVENLRAALKERIDALPWMSAETKAQAQRKLAAFNVKIGYPDNWKRLLVPRDLARVPYRRERAARPHLRDEAQPREARQAHRPDGVGHDAPDGQRLLQLVDERDRLPGGHPPAALLLRGRRRRRELRRHRRRHRPRDVPRVRRLGQPVRRGRQPQELVDAPRTGRPTRRARPRREAVRRLQAARRTRPSTASSRSARTSATSAASRSPTRRSRRPSRGSRARRSTASRPSSASSCRSRRSGAASTATRRMRVQLNTNPHSPGHWRAIGPPSNLPEFYDAFGCAEGAPMRRAEAERPSIW